MSSVNKVMLIGNLGKDPELRHTQSGVSVCNFSLATTESWKDGATGETNNRTEWHKIVVWKALADACAKYLTKGSKVYVEGNIQTKEWNDKDGQKRYSTEINALSVVFLSTSNKPAAAPADDFAPSGQWAPEPAPARAPGPDDDIPF